VNAILWWQHFGITFDEHFTSDFEHISSKTNQNPKPIKHFLKFSFSLIFLAQLSSIGNRSHAQVAFSYFDAESGKTYYLGVWDGYLWGEYTSPQTFYWEETKPEEMPGPYHCTRFYLKSYDGQYIGSNLQVGPSRQAVVFKFVYDATSDNRESQGNDGKLGLDGGGAIRVKSGGKPFADDASWFQTATRFELHE